MKLVKTAFVLALAAFWALVTNHCGLENIAGLDFLTCSTPASDPAPHQPSDCGDDDACATIESGYYKSEESQVPAFKPCFVPVVLALAPHSGRTAPDPAARLVARRSPPIDLARGWQFSYRTALPPRAPSIAS